LVLPEDESSLLSKCFVFYTYRRCK